MRIVNGRIGFGSATDNLDEIEAVTELLRSSSAPEVGERRQELAGKSLESLRAYILPDGPSNLRRLRAETGWCLGEVETVRSALRMAIDHMTSMESEHAGEALSSEARELRGELEERLACWSIPHQMDLMLKAQLDRAVRLREMSMAEILTEIGRMKDWLRDGGVRVDETLMKANTVRSLEIELLERRSR